MKTLELILLQLKTLGPHSVKMLAEQLDITTMGIRQHLHSLQERDLVCYEETRSKVGRPTRYWSLTPQGHSQFTDRNDRLSSALLESAQEVFGPGGIDKLICAREDKFYQRYASCLAEKQSHLDKLNCLVKLRQNDGYMSELIETPEGILLVENHCPTGAGAHSCSALCDSEVRLFTRLFGRDYSIERKSYPVSGNRRCGYLIKPKQAGVIACSPV
ncbi:helix-turn-helix transcriptional regulator [Serratia microhaemolytica]|uniref:helix-turn-helix transcriptional regulator n=1 Tax=Serratia microhaemolytica TaxID=2675110 RepID=UPI000FDD899A|nr:HTH domain-containing protein [Serratia microhaemolytica]